MTFELTGEISNIQITKTRNYGGAGISVSITLTVKNPTDEQLNDLIDIAQLPVIAYLKHDDRR